MATKCPFRFLVLDYDARPIAGPMGPLVVTKEVGEAMIAEAAKLPPHARAREAKELAITLSWSASFGPDPHSDGPGIWTLVPAS